MLNPFGVSTVSLASSRLGVAIGSPELASFGGSSGNEDKDAKEKGVSSDSTNNNNNTTIVYQGCSSNDDSNTDTSLCDLTRNETKAI